MQWLAQWSLEMQLRSHPHFLIPSCILLEAQFQGPALTNEFKVSVGSFSVFRTVDTLSKSEMPASDAPRLSANYEPKHPVDSA